MNTFPDRLCVTRQLELKTVSSASWRDRNRTSNRALCYSSYLKSRLHHSKIFSEMKWDDTLVVYKKQHKPFSFWFCGKWVHKIVPLINVGFTLSPVFYTNGSERNVPLNPSEFFKPKHFLTEASHDFVFKLFQYLRKSMGWRQSMHNNQ